MRVGSENQDEISKSNYFTHKGFNVKAFKKIREFFLFLLKLRVAFRTGFPLKFTIIEFHHLSDIENYYFWQSSEKKKDF